jgi:hypothetical protein
MRTDDRPRARAAWAEAHPTQLEIANYEAHHRHSISPVRDFSAASRLPTETSDAGSEGIQRKYESKI